MKKLALRKTKNSISTSFSGDHILKEIEKQHNAVKERLAVIEISMKIMEIEEKEWDTFNKQASLKAANTKDSNRQATFERLKSISKNTATRYAEQRKKLETIQHELKDAAERLDESMAVLKIERNLHSIISSLPEEAALEPLAGFEENMREVKRVIYTADAVLELTR